MNLVKIICPRCGAEKKLSLVENSYTGPQRCWKCRELFTITIHNNEVRSAEPLGEEEFQKQMEEKAAREGIRNFKSTQSGQDDDIPRLSPERRRNYNQPLSYEATSGQAEPERPSPENTPEGQGSYKEPARQEEPDGPVNINPPERFQTFVPLEDTPVEPKKQEKPKEPPDRVRFFIPPAT